MKLFYEIEMQTLVGIKKGNLYAEILHSEVNGSLYLLKQTTAFHGTVNHSGDCKIQGELISLTKTIPYQAAGKMEKEAVTLDMHTDLGEFHITGKEARNEEILQPNR